MCGPGSVVRIATGYGLNGPGIESRWGPDFPHLSRPALGPTQLPVQWVPGLYRPGRDAGPSPLLVQWLRKITAINLLPLRAVRPAQSLSACTGRILLFTLVYGLYCVEGRRRFCMKCKGNYGCSVRNIKQ